MSRIEIHEIRHKTGKRKYSKFKWKLFSSNGRLLAKSHSKYNSRPAAISAINAVIKAVAKAKIIDQVNEGNTG